MTLALAWFTPFGAFPDELDHYERALSIGNGELVGTPDPEPPIAVHKKTCCASGNPSALAWVRQGVRLVEVDADQQPERLPCNQVVTSARLTCGAATTSERQANAMGTIEPVAYAPGGLIANLFHSPTAAYRATRLAPALLGLVLLAVGLFALQRRFRSPAVFASVVTSMSLGTLAVLASGSPNTFEIAGTVCVLAGGLALADTADPSTADWWCLGAGGFALATSRSLGPIWILALLAIAMVLGSWHDVRLHVRANRRAAITVATIVGLGAASTAAWEAAVQPHVAFDLGFFVHQIGPSIGDAGFASRQFFAAVGALPPALFAWAWGALTLTVVASGVIVGDRRARRAIVVAAFLLVGAFVGVSAAVLRQNGFGIQARHVLPVAIALCVAGGVAWRDRVPPLWASLAAGALAAGLLVFAWGFLRTSYVATPVGLALAPTTWRDALHALRSFPSALFVAGAALAGASIPLSAWRSGFAAPRDARQDG